MNGISKRNVLNIVDDYEAVLTFWPQACHGMPTNVIAMFLKLL